MKLQDTIKVVKYDDQGRIIAIAGSCKAKDLKR